MNFVRVTSRSTYLLLTVDKKETQLRCFEAVAFSLLFIFFHVNRRIFCDWCFTGNQANNWLLELTHVNLLRQHGWYCFDLVCVWDAVYCTLAGFYMSISVRLYACGQIFVTAITSRPCERQSQNFTGVYPWILSTHVMMLYDCSVFMRSEHQHVEGHHRSHWKTVAAYWFNTISNCFLPLEWTFLLARSAPLPSLL